MITAFSISTPRWDSASALIFCKIIADISSGEYFFFLIFTLCLVPIFLLMCIIVFSGLRTACLLAGSPTIRSPSLVNATTDGNIFPPNVDPSAEGMITGLPPSKCAASELVVPKSIPIITSFAILFTFFFNIF